MVISILGQLISRSSHKVDIFYSKESINSFLSHTCVILNLSSYNNYILETNLGSNRYNNYLYENKIKCVSKNLKFFSIVRF